MRIPVAPLLGPVVAPVLAPVLALAFALALAACPSPQMPKGPPPEYEEAPGPSWLVEAGAEGGVVAEGGVGASD